MSEYPSLFPQNGYDRLGASRGPLSWAYSLTIGTTSNTALKVRLALRRSGYIGERLNSVVMFNFFTGFCYHIIGESGGHGTKKASAISECRTWCII
jgi:hypothetical protein